MRPLLNLTIANIRSFTRDRAALFWTLAFPLVFIVLFGTIFSERGRPELQGCLGRSGRHAGVDRSARGLLAGLGVQRSRRPLRPTMRWRRSERATCAP